MSGIVIQTAPLVNVKITSNLTEFTAEKRFDRSLTIYDFKCRLELITGASAGSMTLKVYNEDDKPVCDITNNDALLGSFPVEENYRIHVTDSSKSAGIFDDCSNVEKFQLTEDKYNERTDSVRAFLLRNKLGKYNEEEMKRAEEERLKAEKEEEERLNTFKIGDRCEVRMENQPTRRGEILFLGNVHFKPGKWVGIKYDEPLGKNDGSIEGKRYFDAPMKYGGFTKPEFVEVGDFPEIDFEDDEM